MIDEVLESEDIRVIKQRGGKLPMLQAKGIDFSYGQLQVLFDVDFTVDDGEMVALLGTNGAGKSTLLKVISGIGLPSSGGCRSASRRSLAVGPSSAPWTSWTTCAPSATSWAATSAGWTRASRSASRRSRGSTSDGSRSRPTRPAG